MRSDRWFLCGRTSMTSGDEPNALHTQLENIYLADRPADYSLVVVALDARVDGFDRIAIRLCCTRIVGEVTDAPAALVGGNLAVSLIDRDRNLSAALARLRMRLSLLSDVAGTPKVWLERLPAELPMALELLDELAG